jgi:hypothetical protein
LWGDDFRFGNPDVMFTSMNRLLDYISTHQQVRHTPVDFGENCSLGARPIGLVLPAI